MILKVILFILYKYFLKNFITLSSILVFLFIPNLVYSYEIPENSEPESSDVSKWSIFRPTEVLNYITSKVTSDSEASKSAQEGLNMATGIWETIKGVLGLFGELFRMTINFIIGTFKIVIDLIGIIRRLF